MTFKVIVQGSEYQLDEETKNIMEFFNEAEALQKIESNEPVIFYPYLVLNHHYWLKHLERNS